MKTSLAKPISADTQQLLSHVYQGCQMGIDSLHRMVDRARSDEVKDLLLDLAKEHRRIMDRAANALQPYHTAPEDIGPIDKLRTRMVAMQVSPRHPEERISKTLILGSRMALRTLMRNLHRYSLALNSSQQLAGDLIDLEKRTMRAGLRLARAAAC